MLRTLRPLWPLLRPYRLAFVVGFACILVSLGLKLSIPRAFWETIDELRKLEEGAGPVSPDTARELILRAALLILGAALLIAPIRTASRLLILGTSRRLSRDLLAQVFARLLELAPSFYSRNPTGQLMSRCINDRTYVRSLAGPVFMYMAETSILYVYVVPLMLAIDTELALTVPTACAGRLEDVTCDIRVGIVSEQHVIPMGTLAMSMELVKGLSFMASYQLPYS